MQRPKNALVRVLKFIEESSKESHNGVRQTRSGRGISVASKEGR